MSDATKLPAEQQEAAMRSISAEGLPQAIERQAAAGALTAAGSLLPAGSSIALHCALQATALAALRGTACGKAAAHALPAPTYIIQTGVAEADSIVLLVDGQAGLQPGDAEILDWLRHNHPDKPVTLAVNKCESATKADIQVRRASCLEPFALPACSRASASAAAADGVRWRCSCLL